MKLFFGKQYKPRTISHSYSTKCWKNSTKFVYIYEVFVESTFLFKCRILSKLGKLTWEFNFFIVLSAEHPHDPISMMKWPLFTKSVSNFSLDNLLPIGPSIHTERLSELNLTEKNLKRAVVNHWQCQFFQFVLCERSQYVINGYDNLFSQKCFIKEIQKNVFDLRPFLTVFFML